MDPIEVPAPPRSAYNPNRRVSDLLLGQLSHFQHLEQKHEGLKIDPALGRDIHTEAGAARYIAAITRALRGEASAAPAGVAVMPGAKPRKEFSRPSLSLAAAAAPSTATQDSGLEDHASAPEPGEAVAAREP